MTIRNCLVLGAFALLLLAGAAEAQLEEAGSLRTGLDLRDDAVFGDIALAADENRRVVLAIDSEGKDGLADRMIVFEAGESVEGLDSLRGYGLVRLGSESVKLTLPELQETLSFSTKAEETAEAELSQIGVRRFLNGRSLKTWTPHPGTQLALEEALQAEIQPAESGLRSLAGGLEPYNRDQDDDDGTGGCATSCSVTCHDETSCSASCPSNCAACSCPNATCGCTG